MPMMILVFTFVSSVFAVEPYIFWSTPTSQLNVVVNETVELSCGVKESSKLTWTKIPFIGDSTTLAFNDMIIVNDPRISVQLNKEFFTLQIKNITTSDAAEYRCAVPAPSGKEISKLLKLEIRAPPAILQNTTSSVTVEVNGTIKLECYVTGIPEPTVMWSREDDKPLPHDRTNNVLYITKVRKEDAGLYYCTAKNEVARPVRKTYKLDVLYAPEVEVTRSRVGQALQHVAELECTVSAVPDPKITWVKNNTSLPVPMTQHYKDIRSTFPNGVTVSKLQITVVNSSQYGFYTCGAENGHGEASKTIEFYQTSEPEFFTGGSSFSYSNWKCVFTASFALILFLV